MRKTLEGGRPWRERAPLERGALSLQTSLSPENFPQEHPPLYGGNLFRYVWAGALGESFLFLGRYFYMVRLSHPFCVWGAFGEYTLLGYHIQPHSPRQSGAIAALFKNSHLPPNPKLPHKTPTINKAKQNFARVMVGVLWGKFGEVEGGLEGEGTPSERGFLLPPRSFHPLPPPRQPQNETVEEVEERRENESNHQNRGNRANAEQKSHR